MIEAIATSNTGLNASQSQLNTTGNNLANLSTTGFKANQTTFQDLVYTNLTLPGGAGPNSPPVGTQIGQGVGLASTDKTFAQGPLQNTGQSLNVAIDGNGFFQVKAANGSVLYTRGGSFQLDSQGRLVTSDGSLVQPPITVPSNTTTVTIAANGTVSVVTSSAPNTSQVVGNLTLVRFANPPGLNSVGNNLYAATSASGSPVTNTPGQSGTGLLRQGFLEGSNVDPTTELANLLISQEWFVANGHVVQTASEMLSATTDLVA